MSAHGLWDKRIFDAVGETLDDPSRPGPAKAGAPDLADRSLYRHWADERVRYADLDILGHVNNNAIGVYHETGRVVLLRDAGGLLNGRERTAVAARLSIDYLAELHWPADLKIGTCLLRMGRTSFALGSAIFAGDRCIATAETICVMLDQKTRKPVPLTDADRAALTRLAGIGPG